MSYKVNMSQLGIADDTTVFIGEAPGDIVQQVVEYLRTEYNIAMPDAGAILGHAGTELAVATPNNGAGVQVIGTTTGVGAAMDPDAAVIVRRLGEALDPPKP